MRLQRLIPTLWFIAAALALSAVVVRYFRTGEFDWAIMAAGVFLLAMGLGQLKKPRDEPPARESPPDR